MLEHWACIESDFEREYKINLCKDLKGLSWRKFTTLVRGLSGSSNWVEMLRYEQKKLQDQVNGITPIEDEKLAERAVDRIW